MRLREDRHSAAVYTAPWRLVDAGTTKDTPVRIAGLADAELDLGAIVHTLEDEQRITMASFHEAGHAIVYTQLGIAVTGVTVAPDGHRQDGAVHGLTGFDSDQRHPLPYWIAGHLAGQVAAEHYLELENAAEPGNRVISHLQAADDYRKLLYLRAAVPLIFYYGSCDHLPMPSAVHVEIDAMRTAVRRLLCDVWPAVTELAERLRTHGSAEPGVLARLEFGALTRAELEALFAAAVTGAVREDPDPIAPGAASAESAS